MPQSSWRTELKAYSADYDQLHAATQGAGGKVCVRMGTECGVALVRFGEHRLNS